MLLGDNQLRQLLGVPTDVLLRTVIISEPPPLPNPHLSRSSVFGNLARTFDSHRVVATTGYPECGKTVAMAEFAAAYPGDVFWFSATRSETHPDAWLGLFSFALAQHLGAASLLPSDLLTGLLNRRNALLLVIDNAQFCNDLDALKFLFEAAEATSAISVLLVGTDQPAFVSAVRSRGLVDWRLPGLEEQEARALFELTDGDLSSNQANALDFLRLRVDGHLGMLRLSRPAIRRIETGEQRDAFIAQISSTLGAGLDSLQAAMIERLREGLHDDEIELCRRLSIVVGSFPKRVGEHVWALDRPAGDFHKPWNGCVVGVFESQRSGKYSLPDLYRDGFQQEADRDAVKLWHGAIADAFEEREAAVADIFDIHAAVVHRLLSGTVAAALESASMYLALARGPYARAAQAFLIRRFEMWLAGSAKDPAVPATQRIRWFAIRARVYSDLDLKDKSESATRELYDLLRSDLPEAAPEAVLLGWSIVLMHASTAGRPALALSAVSKIEQPPIPIVEDSSFPWREFLVISAYLNSSESPLPYLRTVINARASQPQAETLWGAMTGYEFWRAVTAAVYSRARDGALEHESAVQLADEIGVLASDCRSVGELHVACLTECLLVHVQIDLLRDFETACAIAQSTSSLATEATDVRAMAYVHDTLGDALRCSGQDEDAVSSYLQALECWPDSETSDRAETLLMLGISQAKLGRFREGSRSARAAAQLHAHPTQELGIGISQLSAARCLLEAAAFSIHGNDYSKSSRCLIEAHELLKDKRNTAEWPALGQIAWSLANKLKPDPIDPQPPVPGFTLGLGDTMIGAEKMVSSAPTMMLARACAAVGQPHRALSYFEAALAECDESDLRMQIGIMALDAAIEAKNLAAATKYSAMGSSWLVDAPPESPPDSKAFVFDYLIGRTIQIASMHQDEQQALSEINRAVSALDELPTDNAAIQLLATTLRAYGAARANGDDTALEDAFQLALEHRALWAARDIAWYWCFRFLLGRPAYENQYSLWHWRMCWLSLEIAPNDVKYLSDVLDQERSFWNRIPDESRSDTTFRVLGVLEIRDQPPNVITLSLISELATVACEFFNVTDVSRELAAELRLAKDASCLGKPLDTLYIRLLDLLLHPGAPHVLSTLRGDITSVLEGLGSSTARPETVDQFRGLDALAQVLEVGTPSEQAFEALRRACGRASELSSNSGAQVYIWLRHFAQFSPDDFGFEEISKVLNSTNVAELLQDKDLLPYVKIRLATCHLTARAFGAQRRLGHALALIGTQENMQSPMAVSAVSSAEAARDSALDELATIVNEFQAIKEQAEDAGLKNELWSCCLELGGLRRLTGTALLVQGHDESAKENWLRPSIDDFRKAVDAAKPLDSSERVELALKAAFSGQSVARALEDQSTLSEFVEAIDQVRSMGSFDELIAAQETLESNDILNLSDHPRDGRGFLKPDDEDAIQYFTDHMMQSTGWPEDRRKYVEDDVRKMARIEQEQEEYCQHLQPLQNLLHTRSPHTVYASPTKYTCSCTLLGYQTQIETDEIDTVLNAMKRVYCEGCERRSPRDAQ
ncbi:MAG: hypothetical protein WD049_01015 [Candidatus Paceibacterota bacterium]